MTVAEPTLFYDANCTLCAMWKEGVEASGWRAMRFEDANDEAAARRLGVHDIEQLQRRMCLLQPNGAEAWGYDAVVELLRLGDATRGIADVLTLRPIARAGRWIYDRVAASRPCAR